MSRAASATLTLAPGSQAWVTASNHSGEPIKNPPTVADFFYSASGSYFVVKMSVPRWVYSTFCNLKLVM
ncbi:hypothetical protein C3709_06015 [Lelliottia aquatilis]|uniref:Uncharacterized protein n=1 Tax=Lelliottia aquatilis TaxID=2080838 RepID=A0ABX5A5Z1_9ENTR|nr:hypothetical protein [Lelliottia aquatilis]POZ28356.1 hypothetical protein C3708_06020 [Lelliottia sp. 7254-16]POZ17164.1 hypothetical protein C3Z09_08985 [Lelliottia aquatilis]POZ25180.1 hypothetical protein C3712_06015 [Lelliottia aquatilis]POZ30153.1 hypothetical protein C3711_03225 [Lelliottia aquatilis]